MKKIYLLTVLSIVASSYSYAQQIASGNAHHLYIFNDGPVQSWGSKSIGELGNCPSKPEKNTWLNWNKCNFKSLPEN